jgi:hypothetical protein
MGQREEVTLVVTLVLTEGEVHSGQGNSERVLHYEGWMRSVLQLKGEHGAASAGWPTGRRSATEWHGARQLRSTNGGTDGTMSCTSSRGSFGACSRGLGVAGVSCHRWCGKGKIGELWRRLPEAGSSIGRPDELL